MKTVAIILISLMLVSMKPERKIFHYPDFMAHSYFPTETAIWSREGYCKGVFVKECNDYMVGVDSIAIKYLDYRYADRSKYATVYTGFYSRAGNLKWKKYSADKKYVGVITEYRNDTVVDKYPYSQCKIIYYKVK